ncbi:MAG: response regulator [Acidobacteriota bacterium]
MDPRRSDGAGLRDSVRIADPAANPAPASDLSQIKGAFLASLNHEVRTPLSGILGMLDLLSETPLDQDQLEYLSAARLCADSLAELLNATLEFTALEGGQCSLDESEFCVREALQAAVEQQHSKAQLKNLQLSIEIDPELPETMVGDAQRIREVAARLIGNAVKFTTAGSVRVNVSFTTRPSPADALGLTDANRSQSEVLIVSVVDTGIGIHPNEIERIFESFRQAEDGLSRTYPGLGLGLALAKKLTTVMGGEISVRSVPGQGSTFTAEIPLRRPTDVLSPEVLADADPVSANLDPPLILAVEDNPINLRVLQQVLERRRVRVVSASSGPEALAAVDAHRFDVILMDLQMPGMDGLQTTVEMRKSPRCANVPIIALTANCADQVRQQCTEAGMQGFLSKPLNTQDLWQTLEQYLKRILPR